MGDCRKAARPSPWTARRRAGILGDLRGALLAALLTAAGPGAAQPSGGDVGQSRAQPEADAPARTATSGTTGAGGSAVTRSGSGRVEEGPVWEAGLGATALSLPDYRGSEKSRAYLLPIPYFVYRGPRFSVDRGGLQAELLEEGGLELDFSVNLSVPVRSDGNPARAGMPNLRPALEIGPQLIGDLWVSPGGRATLQLQLPLRYAFALSTDTRDAGFIFHPRLGLDVTHFGGFRGLNAGLVVGPMFATQRQHDYFYTVDPQFATATRPAYQARGGYSGMQLTLSLSKRFPKHWFGAFVRADWLKGAVFEDSPLVTSKTTVAAGFAISWIFAESADRIAVRERSRVGR